MVQTRSWLKFLLAVLTSTSPVLAVGPNGGGDNEPPGACDANIFGRFNLAPRSANTSERNPFINETLERDLQVFRKKEFQAQVYAHLIDQLADCARNKHKVFRLRQFQADWTQIPIIKEKDYFDFENLPNVPGGEARFRFFLRGILSPWGEELTRLLFMAGFFYDIRVIYDTPEGDKFRRWSFAQTRWDRPLPPGADEAHQRFELIILIPPYNENEKLSFETL